GTLQAGAPSVGLTRATPCSSGSSTPGTATPTGGRTSRTTRPSAASAPPAAAKTKPTLCHAARAAPTIGPSSGQTVGSADPDVLTRPISVGGVSFWMIVGDAISTPAEATPTSRSTGVQATAGSSRLVSRSTPINATRPPTTAHPAPSNTNGLTIPARRPTT